MVAVGYRRALVGLSALIALGAGTARAEDAPRRADVWSLKLGTPASALPNNDFIDYACGSNGGPPQQPLAGWSDYDKCRPEPNGLREVYFRYDDELEYWARAHRAQTLIAQYGGTKVLDFPVVLSGLFDAGGTLAGLRIVTDPQASPQERKQAYTLSNFFKARYGSDGWDCIDTPPAPGETPVGTLYINQRCTKLGEGRYASGARDPVSAPAGPSRVQRRRQADCRRVRKLDAARTVAPRRPGRVSAR